jgi:hypothetical protein
MAIFALLRSTPLLSDLTLTFTLASTTRFIATRTFMDFPGYFDLRGIAQRLHKRHSARKKGHIMPFLTWQVKCRRRHLARGSLGIQFEKSSSAPDAEAIAWLTISGLYEIDQAVEHRPVKQGIEPTTHMHDRMGLGSYSVDFETDSMILSGNNCLAGIGFKLQFLRGTRAFHVHGYDHKRAILHLNS